ncbi:ABC-three component system middle component 1 [Priestia aryabhattai]|uniref:hypothetical protein n=1 Tax=Priestia aryabhattai TaxID=412384 RepID=UPI003D2768C0
MNSLKVNDYFVHHNFKEKKFYHPIKKSFVGEEEVDILPFNKIFISSDNNEIYIVEEKDSLFTTEEIDEMDGKILAFIQFLPNKNPIKYNINLLLLCPLPSGEKTKEVQEILGYERSKYTCRKIFLDTSSQDFQQELSILPSFPLQVNLTLSERRISKLTTKVKEMVKQDLYHELLKEEEEIELEDILSLLEIKGDTINE